MSRNVLELGACGARHTGPAVVDANADRTALEERRVELNTVMPAAADVGVSEGRGIEVDFVAYRHVIDKHFPAVMRHELAHAAFERRGALGLQRRTGNPKRAAAKIWKRPRVEHLVERWRLESARRMGEQHDTAS